MSAYDPNQQSPAPQDGASSLKDRLISRMPAAVQDKLRGGLAQLDAHMPVLQSRTRSGLAGAQDFLGPLWQELRSIMRSAGQKIAVAGPSATLGGTFRHLCFVGLNRAELLISGESQPAFNDSWTDLASDNIKRHTALAFFAPRGLDGKPVNPYLFLVGEGTTGEDDIADPAAISLAEQTVGPMALLDLCRISPAPPNTVNLLLVADTLFHWDIKDNYVLPTTPTGWVRDLEQVLRTYPRTTRAHLYTQWDTDILPPSDRITIQSVREMPLDDGTWLNKPTFQERYGGHMVFLGIVAAALTYAGLWYQQRNLTAITDQLNMIEQQIPRGGHFSDLERAISEQEKMWQKRDLFSLVVKDTARAIQHAGMKVTSFEVRVTEPENPPANYIVTIDAKPNAYEGWLQQEPIARSVILNSAVLDAIRKPPTTSGFKLEGLVNANLLARIYKQYSLQQRTAPAASPTTPAPATGKSAAGGIFPVPSRLRPVEPAAGMEDGGEG